MPVAFGEVVHHRDIMALLEQKVNSVGTDVSGAASD